MQVFWKVLFVFCAFIAAVYLLGTVVWMIAAVFANVELGSLAYISVTGILVIVGLLAGALLVLRKVIRKRS